MSDRYVLQRVDDGRCWCGGDKWGGPPAALWFETIGEAERRGEMELKQIAWQVRRLDYRARQVIW